MNKENFFIDERITSSCFEIGNWPLCRVFLKNNSLYPWLILVPRINNAREIYDLPQTLGYQLIDEIRALSSIHNSYFKPDKLNVGYLGNSVSQLHIHIVGRSSNDSLWPHGIWQAALENMPYESNFIMQILKDLKVQINNSFKEEEIVS